MIIRLLFESPWPLIIALLAIACMFAVAGRRRDDRRLVRAGIFWAAAAAGAFVLATLVETPAESARVVARQLVSAAERADVETAQSLFAADALMSLASPTNPGESIDTIRARLELLRGRYAVDSATITRLDARTMSWSRAEVELSVTAQLHEAFVYAMPSSWILRIERQPDGSWKITHLTFVSFGGGQTPTQSLFR